VAAASEKSDWLFPLLSLAIYRLNDTLRSVGFMNRLTANLLETEVLLTLKMHGDKLLGTSITTIPNDFAVLYSHT